MAERMTQRAHEKSGEVLERPSPFVSLAPLAGVSDVAFRELCFEYGAQGATTEMVSAKALYYDSARTKRLMERGDEGELVLQLFGHEPDVMVQVLREEINDDPRFCAVELNMGCPAPKIVKNGDGSALMRDPKAAGALLEAMVEASAKPVHLKMRLGWDDETQNYLEMGKIAEDAGVRQLTLHARTREQQYSGVADWEAIARLKDAVSVPVIGNGDVRKPEDAARMLEQTRADGIAIGRGAMGNPFLFRQIRELWKSGTYTTPTVDETLAVLRCHYQKEIERRGVDTALVLMRKHTAWYLSGYYGAAQTRVQLMEARSADDVWAILDAFERHVKAHGDPVRHFS
ncbi:MAG: tRNA dihydrouridine synthase DusB [Peptoniphilaceae bacterium]|nr:tRNA dihydrouridine synthase DusB [Peptoniphilaceae bacterium]